MPAEFGDALLADLRYLPGVQSNDTLLLLEHAIAELHWTQARSLKLEGGRINENYLVDSDQGCGVFRLYPRGRSRQQIEFEMSLLTHLHAVGCSVPRVLSPPGQTVYSRGERHYVWLEYLDAKPLSLSEAAKVPPERLAQLLRPIRKALESYAAPYGPVSETRIFERRLPHLTARLEAAGRADFAENIVQLFRQLVAWSAKVQLPSSVIHADVHPGNVLSQADRLWLIDFDDGHVGVRAVDWVLPALEFSLLEDHSVDETRFEILLKALRPENATPEEEQAEPLLRVLLELKFAVSLADCGESFEKNPYLSLLEQRLVRTTPQLLFRALNFPL